MAFPFTKTSQQTEKYNKIIDYIYVQMDPVHIHGSIWRFLCVFYDWKIWVFRELARTKKSPKKSKEELKSGILYTCKGFRALRFFICPSLFIYAIYIACDKQNWIFSVCVNVSFGQFAKVNEKKTRTMKLWIVLTAHIIVK